MRIAEEGEGAGRQAGCPQDCAVIIFGFRHDWGSLEGHTGLQSVQEC